jgi:hypothetical protein
MKLFHSHPQGWTEPAPGLSNRVLLAVVAGFLIALLALAIGLNLTDPELLAGAAFGPSRF